MSLPNDKRPLASLSEADIYQINEEVTQRVPFVRDSQLLRSAVERPYLVLFGEEQFPTLIEKAAATLHALAYHHLFADGNKRTAVRATELFLNANGLEVTWGEEEIEAFVLRIAQGDVEIAQITEWLRERTLAAGPRRELGLTRDQYAIGIYAVACYALLMLLVGGVGSAAASLVLMLVPYIIIGLAVGRLMHASHEHNAFEAVGLIPARPLRDLGLSLVAAILCTAIASTAGLAVNQLLVLLDRAPEPVVHQTLQRLQEEYSAQLLVNVIISAVILAPIIEELIFRGVLQTCLLNLLGHRRWLTIVTTSAAFSLTHWWVVSWQGLIPLFVVGLVLGYVYERTGSLLAAALTHAGFNSINIAISVASIPQSN